MSDELGMYRMDDPEFHKVKVGRFVICRQDDKSIWMQDGEEGTSFNESHLEAAIIQMLSSFKAKPDGAPTP